MNYLIAGAGGTGGALAAALASAGKPVTMIARGEHLAAIREHGLILRLELGDIVQDTVYPSVNGVSAEEYEVSGSIPDVIFVCTKSYSVPEIAPFLNRVAGPDTIVIPILNGIRMGDYVRRYVHAGRVIDGCIYVVAMKDAPGRILRKGHLLRAVFGCDSSTEGNCSVPEKTLGEIAADLRAGGVDAAVSSQILKDTILKFAYVAPTGAAGIYYNTKAGGMQQEGPARDLVVAMTDEIQELGEAMGISFDYRLAEASLKVLDGMPQDSNASLQRDIMAGKPSEFASQMIEPVLLGERYGLRMESFRKVVRKIAPEIGIPVPYEQE